MQARIFTGIILILAALPAAPQSSVGIFEGESDIGTLLHPGASEYDSAKKTYTLTSGGENMWAAEDDFHFVWKKVTGDITFSADIAFATTTGNPHKKGVLMVRRTLDNDSDYVDAALHLAGLTSLQSRDQKGATTREVQSWLSSPKRLRLEKRGSYFFLFVAGDDGVFHLSGGSMKLALDGPFYVGLGACAHDKDAVEKVVFSNVDLAAASALGSPKLFSTLEAVPVQSTDRRSVYVTEGKIESPNWTRDGSELLFDANGHIMKIAAKGGTPEAVDTGRLDHLGSHHGISPDGTMLALTEESKKGKATIYVMPLGGGKLRPVTKLVPSWWQGWSPDGKTLLFTGIRKDVALEVAPVPGLGGKGKDSYGILTIPAAGGEETALHAGDGDNPVYSADGKYIYFDSVRGGSRQVWRMLADGTKPEPVTNDEFVNWHPHASPDGQQLAFLSCDRSMAGNSGAKDIQVRSMALADRTIRVIANISGGDGTFDSAPWSADSKTLSFVSYQMVPQ